MALVENFEEWKLRTGREPKRLQVGQMGCPLFEYAGKFVKYPNLKNESMKAQKEVRAIIDELSQNGEVENL